VGKANVWLSIIIILLVVIGVGVVGYRSSQGGTPTTTSPTSQASPTTTTTSPGRTGKLHVTAATIKSGISSLDIVGADKGIQEAAGVNFTILRLNTPPQVVDAILKGDAQIAIVPVELAAVIMEKGGNVYIIALDNQMNQAILVRPGSGIHSPADLKGKKVAAVVGSGTYAIFKALMKEDYNLTVGPGPNYDVQVVNMPPPNVVDALARGDVDAAVIWEPLVSEAVVAKHLVILANFTELWEKYAGNSPAPMLVWVASKEVVDNKALLNAVLEAHRLATLKWNNEENWTVTFLSKFYNIDPSVARMVWARDHMYTGKCINQSLAQAMYKIWGLAEEAGYISKVPSMDRIITCQSLGMEQGSG